MVCDKNERPAGHSAPPARSTDRTDRGRVLRKTHEERKGRYTYEKTESQSFLAGVLTALLAAAPATTALAVSGAISYNGVTVAVGGAAQAAGDITTAEGQAPGSIQFTDGAGNVTHYLPLETIGQLPGVDAVYDPAARTVKLERGNLWEKQETERGVQYASEDTGISYDAAPSYAPAVLPEGWVLESVREAAGRSGQEYLDGQGGRISFYVQLSRRRRLRLGAPAAGRSPAPPSR